VLIIDDDEVTLMTYVWGLQREGYTVRTATSAASGWCEWTLEQPAVLILDLRLPTAADGLQFLRDLRARAGGGTPVAVVTGEYALDDQVRSVLSALNARLLFKPIWVEELIELVADLILSGPTPMGPADRPTAAA
jgi:DNA-binding response OmpR family regulator